MLKKLLPKRFKDLPIGTTFYWFNIPISVIKKKYRTKKELRFKTKCDCYLAVTSKDSDIIDEELFVDEDLQNELCVVVKKPHGELVDGRY